MATLADVLGGWWRCRSIVFLWNHLSFTSRDAGDFYEHVLCKVFIAIAITGTVYSL